MTTYAPSLVLLLSLGSLCASCTAVSSRQGADGAQVPGQTPALHPLGSDENEQTGLLNAIATLKAAIEANTALIQVQSKQTAGGDIHTSYVWTNRLLAVGPILGAALFYPLIWRPIAAPFRKKRRGVKKSVSNLRDESGKL